MRLTIAVLCQGEPAERIGEGGRAHTEYLRARTAADGRGGATSPTELLSNYNPLPCVCDSSSNATLYSSPESQGSLTYYD